MPDLAKCRWLLFVPTDWVERLRRDFEKHQAERRDRGEIDHLIKVTTDRQEYERSQRKAAHEDKDLTLGPRLKEARVARGLSQKKAAEAFGVGQPTLARWERGIEPDEDGKVRGKPVPQDQIAKVEEWISKTPT